MLHQDPSIHVESIIEEFERINTAREQAIDNSRKVVRASATSIRAAHRGEFDDARAHLDDASRLLSDILDQAASVPSVTTAGYVQDAMKEVAEAHITLAYLADRPLPGPNDVGVSSAAWLNGLAEAASEIRRDALDALRQNEVERAEALLQLMDRAYSTLVTIDFPDAITNGIRRTTDQLRAVLERTRGDVTFAIRQDRLERMLQRVDTSSTDQSNDGDF